MVEFEANRANGVLGNRNSDRITDRQKDRKTERKTEICGIIVRWGAFKMYRELHQHELHYVFQLAAVTTCDKSMTFMHYLVEFTRTTYPKLLGFHKGLDIAVKKGS